jgi:SAM-dependent methyltransferase
MPTAAPAVSLPARQAPPYALIAPLYDAVMGDAAFPTLRAGFEWCLRRYGIRFATVADIGCGSGRFLSYLRRYGVPRIGVDRCAAMLRVAAQRPGNGGVTWLRQDMAALRLPRPVELITCNFDTLNYLWRQAELSSTLARFNQNLLPQGYLICDLIARQTPPENRTYVQEVELPGTRATWVTSTDVAQGLSVTEIALRAQRNGTPVYGREIHLLRWCSIPRMRALLGASGFRILGIRDAATLLPATHETPWVKYIARKQSAGPSTAVARWHEKTML